MKPRPALLFLLPLLAAPFAIGTEWEAPSSQKEVELLHRTPLAALPLSLHWKSLRRTVPTGPWFYDADGHKCLPLMKVSDDVLTADSGGMRQALDRLPPLPEGLHSEVPQDNRLVFVWDPSSEVARFQPAFGEPDFTHGALLNVGRQSWPEELGYKPGEVPPPMSFFYLVAFDPRVDRRPHTSPVGLGFGSVDDQGKAIFASRGDPDLGPDLVSSSVLNVGRDHAGRIWIWFE